MVMLVEFSVENFRSFKEEAVLSMEASADKTHPDNMVTIGKDRIIKTAAIFAHCRHNDSSQLAYASS